MHIKCKYSGVSFQVPHFSASLTRGETFHPIFSIPQHKLLSFMGKWSEQSFPPIDSYLLALALLHSTELVDWRAPVIYSPEKTDPLIANSIINLSIAVTRINSAPHAGFPRVVINHFTQDLSALPQWIIAWNDTYSEWRSGYISRNQAEQISRRENALERLIKSPHRNAHVYARKLAAWASVAGSFPTFPIISPFTNLPISLSHYWQQIIIRAAGKESIHGIPTKDLIELQNHCEDNIVNGGIFAHALFEYIRSAIKIQGDYLGFDPAITEMPTFTIVRDGTEHSITSASLAPESCPVPENYPTRFAYLKDKFRWDQAVKAGLRKNP